MNKNPFELTKATDLTDKYIQELWVEYINDENKNLELRLDPMSTMPKFIIGGKGSGKTHALRYFSYGVKKYKRDSKCTSCTRRGNCINCIKDNYIGILIRSEEINVHRFSGKNIPEEVWKGVFAYYFELWVVRLIIKIIMDFKIERKKEFCADVIDKFTEVDFILPEDLDAFYHVLTQELKFIDHSVNNCIFDDGKELRNINIKVTSGELLFNIPVILGKYCQELKGINFIYMLDQYEDFNDSKQKYINTLIRYKNNNATFWIGSRYYGIKTYDTEIPGESNKEGAEYSVVNLDDFYRKNSVLYNEFAKKMIISRLIAYDLLRKTNDIDISQKNEVFYLDHRNLTALCHDEPKTIAQKMSIDRQYINKIKNQLTKHVPENQRDLILSNISAKEYPLLEKAAILEIYKNWKSSKSLLQISEELKNDINESISLNTPKGKIKKILHHFKTDLLAQLYQEAQQPIYSYGIDEIIDLSYGNPRHLLTLLKKIYSWAVFNSEVSDNKICISIKSQAAGIREASEWLYEEPERSVAAEPVGKQVTKSVTRLCNLYRAMRYSSKPSESSLCAFAVNLSELSDEAKQVIVAAQQLLQIVYVGTSIDKNTSAKHSTFQINRLLAPRWGLPLSHRGTVTFSKDEINAIFVADTDEQFKLIKTQRLCRMEPPFKSLKNSKIQSDEALSVEMLLKQVDEEN